MADLRAELKERVIYWRGVKQRKFQEEVDGLKPVIDAAVPKMREAADNGKCEYEIARYDNNEGCDFLSKAIQKLNGYRGLEFKRSGALRERTLRYLDTSRPGCGLVACWDDCK